MEYHAFHDWLATPGFLHAGATTHADLALVSMLFVALLFTFGVIMAIKQHYEIHRWTQTTGVIFSTVIAGWLMARGFAEEVIKEGPKPGGEVFYVLLASHGVVGIIAVLLGVFIALRANGLVPKRLQFNNYKLVMRCSYGLYMLAVVLGVWVYVVMPDRVAAA